MQNTSFDDVCILPVALNVYFCQIEERQFFWRINQDNQ